MVGDTDAERRRGQAEGRRQRAREGTVSNTIAYQTYGIGDIDSAYRTVINQLHPIVPTLKHVAVVKIVCDD